VHASDYNQYFHSRHENAQQDLKYRPSRDCPSLNNNHRPNEYIGPKGVERSCEVRAATSRILAANPSKENENPHPYECRSATAW
jgi:hypothetical protein